MYTDDESLMLDLAGLGDLDLYGVSLTPLDPEFHHVISDPRLAAEFAALREPRAEPTTAYVDGSARARRDARIARRAHGSASQRREAA
ncbi:hypothetical protein [Kibdelosporangium phytohabitans]|uniref:Uncharacterized protein n=1 Tax=Kibdelosporangium phytohabitans TaxID=860235 RepID=A0A0N9HVG1_9PSEU|nr:hypothetical protein [Kibdelosporangium phytohabitans]ALG05773.1 hypothetical protein AOZ06_01505 [Kibdelosporangium phytohabitans]MBE1466225.1 hypothetical protein [Kibdelosporangium phytohabitans]